MVKLMRLFEVKLAPACGQANGFRTCLVLADNEDDARTVVPQPAQIDRVIADPGLVSAVGPSRVIGWMAETADPS